MPVFSVVSPYLVNLEATDLTSAVRKFAKTYYHMKINEIIIKDHMKNYRATLKYIERNGRPAVGLRMFPYMYPVVASTTPINQVVVTPQPGNVVRKDGSIQEYNYSPTMMVTHTVKTTVPEKTDDDADSAGTFVMSPLSPMAPFGFFPRIFG